MKPGEPSRTAFGAAMLRALHQDLDQPRIFTDPLAWRILGNRESLMEGAGQWERSRLRRFIAVRHRFAEDSLAAAVLRGTQQVVVLGAGLDTLAYRNVEPGLRFYEVDHPATGRWKRERLADAGIEVPDAVSFVEVDFESESFLDELAATGFDAGGPAFFLWLGVVPYLSREAVIDSLRTIGSIPGGEVVFDYISPVEQVPEPARLDREELTARVAELGEPLRAGWDTGRLHHLLRESGFAEIEDLGRPEIRSRYLGVAPGAGGGGGHVVRARVPRAPRRGKRR
ncbi:SAM-dependent methyltransferase [Nocardioides sp.]|jgi:methyltransferase (TIGR00027 family)|uniref:class I SAM-dependent methyltransferase n=1 Tax=Nocardioides sp. TaxID=35761 RepID=UPI0031FEDB25|nr:S-adenosyl-L-methionine-dependent methyltransferase [Nocardioides sp.]